MTVVERLNQSREPNAVGLHSQEFTTNISLGSVCTFSPF